MLIHLPREEGFGVIPRTKNGPPLAGYDALAMKNTLAAVITTLPEQLRRSITWDRGKELSAHAQFRIETGVPVYFADPHSPWQRSTNENTYWCSLRGMDSFDGRSQAGPAGDSENTCLRAHQSITVDIRSRFCHDRLKPASSRPGARGWSTRAELANAVFEYIEGFHNRRRRHSAFGWQAPLDFERNHNRQPASLDR